MSRVNKFRCAFYVMLLLNAAYPIVFAFCEPIASLFMDTSDPTCMAVMPFLFIRNVTLDFVAFVFYAAIEIGYAIFRGYRGMNYFKDSGK